MQRPLPIAPLATLLALFCVGALAPLVRAAPPTANAAPAKTRLLVGDYSKKLLAIVDDQGSILWRHAIDDIHDAHELPGGNILFQTGWTHLVEVDPSGRTVWQYDAASQNGNSGKKVEVHAFQRLENGVTMIAESGPGRIIEVDRDGKLLATIPLKLDHPDPHRDTRLVRKLKNGRYLVAHEGDQCVREYESQGKVVWEYDAHSQVYSAQRLENGNTLIGAGDGAKVLEVSPTGQTVWSIERQDLPGVSLAWVTMVDRLPNGDTLLVNCHAGPDNPQVLTVTPDKKVVWQFRDFDRFGNSLPVARLLGPAK